MHAGRSRTAHTRHQGGGRRWHADAEMGCDLEASAWDLGAGVIALAGARRRRPSATADVRAAQEGGRGRERDARRLTVASSLNAAAL